MRDKYEGVILTEVGKKTRLGGFLIQPIPLEHNAENYGFIITHKAIGKLVYAVDCSCFPYKVKGVTHWILEANHDEGLMIDRLCDNVGSRSHYENHLNIEQTLEALRVNEADVRRTIILAHLSNGNSDEKDFLKRVMLDNPKCKCYVADKGLEIELSNGE